MQNERLKTTAQETIGLLQTRGWSNVGSELQHGGPLCLVEAIATATFDSPALKWRDGNGLIAILQHRFGGQVTAWNDAPGRTEEDVYQVLESFGAERCHA